MTRSRFALLLLAGLLIQLVIIFGLGAAGENALAAEPAAQPAAVAASIAANRMPVVRDQQIIIGECPGLDPRFEGGCTYPLAVAPIYLTDPTDRWTLYHEFGHRFAIVVMTQGDRNRFGSIMHYGWTIVSTNERLADAYATCALEWMPAHDRTADANFPTGNLYWPTRSQQRRVCGMLRRAAR
jgi:hypothetical protein